jgi:hypothetical protein
MYYNSCDGRSSSTGALSSIIDVLPTSLVSPVNYAGSDQRAYHAAIDGEITEGGSVTVLSVFWHWQVAEGKLILFSSSWNIAVEDPFDG